MSRKHYREVAAILRRALSGTDLEGLRVVTLISRELADLFKDDNAAFNRRRFMEAVFEEAS